MVGYENLCGQLHDIRAIEISSVFHKIINNNVTLENSGQNS